MDPHYKLKNTNEKQNDINAYQPNVPTSPTLITPSNNAGTKTQMNVK
jgi:hypothetical protein